jgi:integrase
MSPRAIASLRRHGRHRVSDNLYLQIGKDGRRSWVFRYQHGGKAHMMGLGAAELRTLAEARDMAHDLRRRLHLEHVDPLQHRRVERAQATLEETRSITFEECATRFLKAHEKNNWSKKHRQQWRNTLAQHVYPTIGNVPVGLVGKDEVLRCLEPVWHDLPVTAARVRNRIAQILDWAAARDLRSHDNPAKHPKLLPTIRRQVQHLSAMPYAQVPAFLLELRKEQDVGAKAMEFCILTATRLGEVLGARWGEISGDTWTVPGERMKSGKPHRVPLSRQAVALLQELPRDGDLVFHPPQHPDQRLHHSEPLRVMRRLDRSETVHGFRSSFRDWCSERTGFPYEVCERALAHSTGSQAARAYARSDLLEERRRLMEQWATFLNTPPAERGEVIPMRA